jgi:multidrug efflux pump subunit AcrB
MSRAEKEASNALDHVSLPAEAEKPVVTKISTASFPVMRISLTSPSGKWDEASLRTTVQEQIASELKSLPGVGDILVTGGAKNGYAVTIHMADLNKNGLTVDDVRRSLADSRMTPVQGVISTDRVSIPLQAVGWNPSEQDLKRIPIYGADGHTVPLSDIADLSKTMTGLQTISRTDGAAAVFFDVLKTPSSNITEVSQKVRSRLQDIPGMQAGDIRLSVLFDRGEQVSASLFGLIKEGLLGCLLSMICVFVFFRNVRSTLLVALSLPVCLMTATGILKAMGISLNLLTVSGLIVAMGRVIDDTIVVLDNLHRKADEAGSNITAALLAEAVTEMMPAIVSSTATTVAVYIPIAIVGGMIGSAFSGFSWSVVIALLASLLVAVAVVPALYYAWRSKRKRDAAAAIESVSIRLLQRAIRSKGAFIAACVTLMLLSGIAAFSLPVNFLPATRSGQINVQLEFPEGTALAQVDAAVKRMEQTLKQDSSVASFSSVLGSSFTPQFDDVFDAGGGWIQGENVANIAVTVAKNADLHAEIAAMQNRLSSLAGSAVVTVANQNISGDDSQLKIDLSGADAAVLDTAARLVRSKLQSMDGISVAGAANDKEAPPRFQLTLDRSALEKEGIGPEDVYSRIRTYLNEGTVIEVKAGTETAIPVAIHTDMLANAGSSSSAKDPQTEILTQLGKETFRGTGGRSFRLDELASLSPANGPTVIRSREGRPFSTVIANITSRDVEKVTSEVKDTLDHLALPSGVRYSINGITAQVDQMIYEMSIALTVSALLVLLILSLVFKGWRAPLTVLCCIPLAYIGSIAGMFVTGGEWNLASLVGLLMLTGIVATNGIVLADKIERNLARGMNPREAIVQGAASRARPVLTTAATTVLTLAPLIFSGGSDTVVSQSLGIVVVCGMISSTFIGLPAIPIVYDWLHRPKTEPLASTQASERLNPVR